MSVPAKTVPIAKSKATVAWVHKHVGPVIASMASQGYIDGLQALELLDGLDGLIGLVKFMERYGDAIRSAVARGEIRA